MAVCTLCGTLMHNEDAETHICDAKDIPDKGTPIKKGEKSLKE